MGSVGARRSPSIGFSAIWLPPPRVLGAPVRRLPGVRVRSTMARSYHRAATGLRLTTPNALALDSRSVAACAGWLPRQEVPCSVDASARRRRPRRPFARLNAARSSRSSPSGPSTSARSSALPTSAAGYVEGVSDEHRCYAFGDPAPLSAEQQTRVCQERGYGNCPRYLRGVLVIPTEELEALRRPRAPLPEPLTAPPPAAADEPPPPRGAAPSCLVLLLVVVGRRGQSDIWCLARACSRSPSPRARPRRRRHLTPEPTPDQPDRPSGSLEPTTTAQPSGSELATPTPEPTPSAGDTFAFYEVVGRARDYPLFRLKADGERRRHGARRRSTASRSRGPILAIGADGDVYLADARRRPRGAGRTSTRSRATSRSVPSS